MSEARAQDRNAACVLAAIWLLLAAPWLLGLKTVPYDAAQQFYPAVAFTVQQLHLLQAPWWNPYLFGGYPHFADPQAMTFQPTVVLPMLASSLPSITWFGAVVCMHVLLAGFGALRLGRGYGLGPPAQLLLALVVMYGGVAASRLQHVPMIVSYAWLPWLWWSLLGLSAVPGARNALLAGVIGGLCALQLTQLTFLMALCAAGACIAIAVRQPRHMRGRCLGALAMAALLAAAISAPQWISTVAFLPFSNRLPMSLESSLGGAISWHSLATLVAGGLLSNGHGRYWGGGDLSQDYLYLGTIPLAIWLAWGGSARRARLVRGLSVAAVLALLYALGPRTPLYPLLHTYLPGADLFRRPADALFLFVPIAGLLAALALQHRLDAPAWRPHKIGLIAVLALIGWAVAYTIGRDETPSLVWFLPVAAFGASTILLLRPSRRVGLAGTTALVALLVADLFLHNVSSRFYGTSDPVHALYRDAVLPGAQASDEARVLAQLRELPARGAIPERVEVFGMARLTNAATVRGVALATGYNPMIYAPYAAFFGATPEPLADQGRRSFTPWAPGFDARAFDLLGLRATIERTAASKAPAATPRLRVRDTVLPRILNPRAVMAHDAWLPAAQAYLDTDFERVAWLPASELQAVSCDRANAGGITLGEVTFSANRIGIDYSSERAAWLVLNEIHAPGWVAGVDGQEQPLLRANGMFRGVCVPAGRHRLRFSFRPLRFIRAGWALAAS